MSLRGKLERLEMLCEELHEASAKRRKTATSKTKQKFTSAAAGKAAKRAEKLIRQMGGKSPDWWEGAYEYQLGWTTSWDAPDKEKAKKLADKVMNKLGGKFVKFEGSRVAKDYTIYYYEYSMPGIKKVSFGWADGGIRSKPLANLDFLWQTED